MMKKSVYVGAAVALLLGLLFGRDAVSYVTTYAGQVQSSVQDSVPIEFQLERARNMIKDIDPAIRKNTHEIAKEEVLIDKLAADVKDLEGKLVADEEAIMQLKGDLESDESYVYYNDQRFSRNEVETELAERFDTFKINDATLTSKRQQVEARQKGLRAATDKLAELKAAKHQLEVKVENLQARLKLVEVAKTTADYQFDDSQLSRTKELLGDIDTRIKTEEKMVNTYGEYNHRIPVGEAMKVKRDVTEEVADYFGESRPVRDVVHSDN